ncbi:LamG domain-containing protein [Micromonospora sp. NPDC023737]|uniref:LamG domain-containing protein n=1 Tax=unclassified Micromonospora TaxID=2617518 RepID=UPI0033C8F23D
MLTTTPAAAETGNSVSCPSSTADSTAASRAAAACGAKVEIMSARSEYGQGFANPDGTTTLITSASPRWVHRTDGSWADVDTTLTAVGGDGVAPRAVTTDVRFSAGGTGPLVTLTARGEKFTMAWPGKLPAPTLEGSTARYAEVLPGVDLAMTATATGFQHVLIVKDAKAATNPALRKINFRVGGDVKARGTSDGRVGFTDTAGRQIASTASASVWDSTVDPTAAGEVLPGVAADNLRAAPSEELISTAVRPGLSARSSQLAVGISTAGDLELTPDAAMLTSAKTVYPVFIDPAIAPAASKWAYANTMNSNWDVGKLGWVGSNPYDGVRYRTFYDFPSTSGSLTWKGTNRKILSASANIWLYHSWSCDDTWTHMYRPTGGAITVSNGARMSWSTRPLGSSAVWLDSAASHANKAGGCGSAQPDMLVSFTGTTLKNDVQKAANGSWSTYPVGLCACNESNEYESSQDRWKKFYTTSNTGGHGAPALSVTFDTVPTAPSNLSPYSGVACGGVVGTTSPVLSARYNDADTADTLTATFAWKDLATGTVTQVAGPAKPAGNTGSITLPLGAATEGKKYSFQVITSDGHYSSPWSSWCDFTINASAPPAPNVSSVAYPAGTTAHGGPGVSGDFAFSVSGTTGQDVTSYTYGWTNPPTKTVTVAAGKPSPVLQLTPPRYGLNTLYVYAKDTAGTPGPTKPHTFMVGAPSAAIVNLPLDDIRGHNWTDQVSGNALTLSNPAPTWVQDSRIVGAKSAHFDQLQSGTEAVAALDTSKSFSVAAWLKMTTIGLGNMTAIGQDGATSGGAGGLYLGARYIDGTVHWSFYMKDTSDSSSGGVHASSDGTITTADLNKWVHLTAVYDAGEKVMRLYVNGALAKESARGATPWKATGPLSIGRGWYNGGIVDPFYGDIADVRVWNRVITVDDLNGTDADAANGIPAMPGILAATEIANWDFNGGADCFCDSVTDTAYFGRPLTLDSGWANTPPTSAFVYGGHDGNEMLELDGLAGQAKTSTRVLRTDASLSVSAWVYLTSAGTSDQTVVQQGGGAGSAMKLYYGDSKWVFTISNPNGSGGLNWFGAISDAPAEINTWVHLVGTFDAGMGRVTLYVDGVPQSFKPTGATGWDTTGPLNIGGLAVNSFLQGDIDQVRVFQGLLSAREVANIFDAG